jgi:hypothetical protein
MKDELMDIGTRNVNIMLKVGEDVRDQIVGSPNTNICTTRNYMERIWLSKER